MNTLQIPVQQTVNEQARKISDLEDQLEVLRRNYNRQAKQLEAVRAENVDLKQSIAQVFELIKPVVIKFHG